MDWSIEPIYCDLIKDKLIDIKDDGSFGLIKIISHILTA